MKTAGNNRTWIGADPGGKGKFGIAIQRGETAAEFAVVDCADEAVSFVRDRLKECPAGVGVDSPLWWSSGPSGDRKADQWLRDKYKLSGGTVQASNSLRGAALVQAAMFIQRLREKYLGVPVTEAHPKALLKGTANDNWNVFSGRFRVTSNGADEHERDAIIAAVAAREGFEGRWTHDLATDRYDSEQDPKLYWLSPVHYFWPE